ncbi:hypothetical protein SOVF_022010 isoform A [Spinacia oleracea]|nr:hypothetical protein SOVF_022010 isoform A [Spinacia oleracea]
MERLILNYIDCLLRVVRFALAMWRGHIILKSDDIRKIPEAIQISMKSSRIIVENVIISFSKKGIVQAVPLAGYSMLLFVVLIDAGTCMPID